MSAKTRKLLYDIGTVFAVLLAVAIGFAAAAGTVTIEQVNYGLAVAFAAYAGLSRLASKNTPKE